MSEVSAADNANGQVTLLARNLSRNYGNKRAVRDVDLTLTRGEVRGLLGLNGAGKTTTMQMLTGNLAPTTGAITVCGIDMLDRPTQAKARIGYLPETPPLYKELKVDEYLHLAARLHRVPKARVAEAVATAKRRCGLTDTGGRMIGALSKGFQQRVGIAQAIVHAPDVVILDEPTVGLDPNQRREIRELIRELGRGHSVILSTHMLDEVEMVCDSVQIIAQGSVVFSDSIAAMRQVRSGQRLRVGFRHAPPASALTTLPGVQSAETEPDGFLRVLHAEDRDPTDVIVRASVDHGWGLKHLSRDLTSLEDAFMELTRAEDSAPAAGATA